MSRHTPFPIRSTDNRRSYHTGSAAGFAVVLAVVAGVAGYAGASHALPMGETTDSRTTTIQLDPIMPDIGGTGLFV
jgi:hypothetical protein